ncbi:ABC-type oligopeptide transport system substrate-binding subunit [Croceifilum oryzae]|uniref:ABC-type oligopeptide transport system substrate-binding subunit n=1 Tax=Croceifilum oryzae TaxID=1553429 RepID=A0AAJ1WRG7_9BACL|nr:peptide ABC transporter substrate-binding protein [Croceifilum oryzae]MDQ0416560.1 ABC-type oligopeptide transport system substrate-binding subunit [Croceifilum oryzae]
MARFKRIIQTITKIGKSISYKGLEKLKQAFVNKWNEKEPREHYYQLGKLAVIAVMIVLVYTSFFAMEKGADNSSVLTEMPPQIPDMLRIVETGELRNLDSALVNDQSAQNVLNNIMEGLMRLDKDSKPSYGMAEKVEVSPDYKTYTFTLRKDAKWSDGRPVIAEDFTFAWTRAVDTKNSKNGYLFKNIKGYKEGKIEQGVVASGDKLTVTLVKPDQNFLSLTTNSAMFPQRKDLYEKYRDVFGSDIKTLVSNGPFQLESFTLHKLVAVKNSNYWDHQSVKSNGFIMFGSKDDRDSDNKYVSNEVDFMQMRNKMAEATIKSDVVTVPRATIYYLYVNPNLNGDTKDYYAYAVEKLTDQSSFVKSSSIMPDLIYKRNDLLKKSENGNVTSPIKSDEVTCIDQSEVKRVCEMFKEKVCPSCTMNEVPAKEIREQMKGQGVGLVVNLWKSYYHDPLTFLDIFTTNATENTTGYSNPKYDQLVTQAHEEIDPVKQAKFISEAEDILTYRDKAVIPLYQRAISRLQKPYVQGVVYHPYGPEYSLKWMQVGKPSK